MPPTRHSRLIENGDPAALPLKWYRHSDEDAGAWREGGVRGASNEGGGRLSPIGRAHGCFVAELAVHHPAHSGPAKRSVQDERVRVAGHRQQVRLAGGICEPQEGYIGNI